MGTENNDPITTTSQGGSEPWKAAQPYLKQGLKDADTIYQGGLAAPVNTMSTVVPFADQTVQALDATQNNALANMNGQGISGQAQNIIGSGGFNAPQQASMNYLNKVGENPFDLSGNSAYQTYRSDLAGDVRNAVNMNAAGAGRYGSGMHTGNMVNEMTNALSRADLSQMGRLDALNQQRFNAGQQGMQNLGTAYDMQNQPISDLSGVGSAYEGLNANILNDQLRIADAQMNAPRRAVEWYQAINSGAGALGNTTQTTAQTPNPDQSNPWLDAAGYGLLGAGVLGSIF